MAEIVIANSQLQTPEIRSPYQLLVVVKQCDAVMAFSDSFFDFHGEFDSNGAQRGKEMWRRPRTWFSELPPDEAAFAVHAPILRMPVGLTSGHRGFVGGHDLMGRAILANRPVVNPDDAVAQAANLI